MSALTFLFLALIRYKWPRGQRETVGKTICIHLSLLSSGVSANYFPAGLKLRWVADELVRFRRRAQRKTSERDKQRLTDRRGGKLMDDKKVTKHKERRLEYYVEREGPKESGQYLSLWQPHAALCLARQTVGQKLAYLEYQQVGL